MKKSREKDRRGRELEIVENKRGEEGTRTEL